MSALFEPITVRGGTARNRIWLSPMCQYAIDARDGVPTVITEAAAVVPEGRISPQDAGLWNDEQAGAWTRIVEFLHARGATAGVQLAHAGRKASAHAPWRGHGTIPTADGGWPTSAPSAIAFGDFAEPRALGRGDIAGLVTAFADSARRADAASFDVVELHGAHGYLFHQFLSPLSNDRDDDYGGSFDNRVRFLLETVDAVRKVWPDRKPLLVRLSATDWVDGGWSVADTVELSSRLAGRGVDLVDVSSGGLDPRQQIAVGPGYQVPFAREVRDGAGVATGAVGMIADPKQAEGVLTAGDADVVLLARAALREPAWPLRAAHELGVPVEDAPYPANYTRGAWRD